MPSPSRFASSRPSVPLPDPPLSGELPIDLPTGTRWAVCLTHDVDHLGLREHFVDGFLARYALNLARQNLVSRFRPLRAADSYWGLALAMFGRDRWHVLDELLASEVAAGVQGTWFFPVRKGRGIAFGLQAAGDAARRVAAAGHEVGLHGQSADDADALASEVRDLSTAIGAPITGMRMHYLRLTRSVFDGMERAGLRYDSTVMERKSLRPDLMPLPGPRLARSGIVEFPLHIMDSTLFSTTGLGLSLPESRDYIRQVAGRAAGEGRALVINLHPNSYSRQTPDIRDWYDAVLADLTARSDVFLTDMRGLLARVRFP